MRLDEAVARNRVGHAPEMSPNSTRCSLRSATSCGNSRHYGSASTMSKAQHEQGRQPGIALVGAGIFLSRIAGLLREMVSGGVLGNTAAAGALVTALRIPNLLQNLLGEGVLSASFVPVYSDALSTTTVEASRIAGAVGALAVITAVAVLVIVLLARPITGSRRGVSPATIRPRRQLHPHHRHRRRLHGDVRLVSRHSQQPPVVLSAVCSTSRLELCADRCAAHRLAT